MQNAVRYNVTFHAAGGILQPKNHALIHMTYNILKHGNPSYYSTYEDEDENGDCRTIGEASHLRTFQFTVLQHCIVKEVLDARLGQVGDH